MSSMPPAVNVFHISFFPLPFYLGCPLTALEKSDKHYPVYSTSSSTVSLIHIFLGFEFAIHASNPLKPACLVIHLNFSVLTAHYSLI